MAVRRPKFWTFGSGKGGVGRSFLAASVSAVLARAGRTVVAVDADLGSSNLHTYLATRNHGPTLLQHLAGDATAADVLTRTHHPNLRLLTCAGDNYGVADLDETQLASLIAFVAGLEADEVVVDVGAGTSVKTLDFFNLSDEGIVVVSPDPAAIQGAYAFLRSALLRRIGTAIGDGLAFSKALKTFEGSGASKQTRSISDFYGALRTDNPATAQRAAALVDSFRPFVLLNMVELDDGLRAVEILQGITRRFLGLNIRFGGQVRHDPAVRRAARRSQIPDFDSGADGAAQQICQAVYRMASSSGDTSPGPAAQPALLTGLNDNIRFLGKELHIQTEDLGGTARLITTQVFFRGRVIHSRRTEYPVGAGEDGNRAVVLELMRRQHFEVIRDLESRKEGALLAG